MWAKCKEAAFECLVTFYPFINIPPLYSLIPPLFPAIFTLTPLNTFASLSQYKSTTSRIMTSPQRPKTPQRVWTENDYYGKKHERRETIGQYKMHSREGGLVTYATPSPATAQVDPSVALHEKAPSPPRTSPTPSQQRQGKTPLPHQSSPHDDNGIPQPSGKSELKRNPTFESRYYVFNKQSDASADRSQHSHHSDDNGLEMPLRVDQIMCADPIKFRRL